MAHLSDCTDVRVRYLRSLVHGCGGQNKRVDWASAIRGFVPLDSHEYAGLWSSLALIFPFLAGLLLGLVKGAGPRQVETAHPSVITESMVSHEWTATIVVLKSNWNTGRLQRRRTMHHSTDDHVLEKLS